jgi:hypothetical protein
MAVKFISFLGVTPSIYDHRVSAKRVLPFALFLFFFAGGLTGWFMLTLNPGSSCDVCAEEYGPHCLPHSIPCGPCFYHFFLCFFTIFFNIHRSCPLLELLHHHCGKDCLALLPCLSFLSGKFY